MNPLASGSWGSRSSDTGHSKNIVETKKTALIVTDGAAPIERMAALIAGELSDCRVFIKNAKDFEGTDLLPADFCFIGCEKPDPPSFGYLQKLLQHINLAGRPCGLFSSGAPEAIAYLSRIVQDSEMAVVGDPLDNSRLERIGPWVLGIKNTSRK